MLTSPIRMFADDLTGAADSVAPFTTAGRPVRVLLDDGVWHGPAVAVDGDTRARTEPERLTAIRAFAARALREPDTLVFQKIDSALRGPVAEDGAQMLAALGPAWRAIVAPARPAFGRACLGGVASGAGAVPGRPLAARVAAAGIEAAALSLDIIRRGDLDAALSGAYAAGLRVVVADAETDSDLQAIAAAALRCGSPLLLSGSGGLAAALAGGEGRGLSLDPVGRTLVLVGSFHGSSTAQVGALERTPDTVLLRLDASRWLRADAADAVAAAWRASPGTLVLAIAGEAPAAGDRRLAAAMATAAAPLVRQAGRVVVSGGDTARTLLDALGVRALDILGVAEPGVAVAAAEELGATLVLKSGGVGDARCLVRLTAPASLEGASDAR